MSQFYVRKKGVETRNADPATVLVVPRQGLYFAINRVGSQIWELLDKPQTVEGLVTSLTRQFAVDEAMCRNEVESFLAQLIKQEFVETPPLNATDLS